MKKLIALVFLAAGAALASAPVSAPPALHFQQGNVPLLGGRATLNTANNLQFLGADEARKVIVDLWGNPPESAADVAGIIVPVGTDLLSERGWGVVVTEDQDGHVSDSDAAKLNYTQLMRDMQAATREHNAEREAAGYGAVDLIGWADEPRYDAKAHKMYWAKELAFADSQNPVHSLNYAVRVLGRDNVMELNAVGDMSQLPQIKQGMQAVLQQVSFNPGYRYQDYKAGTDKLATYGIAGLLGVTAAKKVGLLALAMVFLKKAGVLVLAGFAALGRLFKRRAA